MLLGGRRRDQSFYLLPGGQLMDAAHDNRVTSLQAPSKDGTVLAKCRNVHLPTLQFAVFHHPDEMLLSVAAHRRQRDTNSLP